MMQYFVSLRTPGSFQWQLPNSKCSWGEFPISVMLKRQGDMRSQLYCFYYQFIALQFAKYQIVLVEISIRLQEDQRLI